MPYRVSIVDDDAGVLKLLSAIIPRHPQFEVASCLGDSRCVLELISQQRPDIVLIDVLMPEPNGLDCARELLRQLPGIRVVMITGSQDHYYLGQAIAAGASGYILKPFNPGEVHRTLEHVVRGEFLLNENLMEALRKYLDPINRLDRFKLTVREKEILQFMRLGYSDTQIASELRISEHTERTHVNNAFRKLSVQSRGEAVNKVFHA